MVQMLLVECLLFVLKYMTYNNGTVFAEQSAKKRSQRITQIAIENVSRYREMLNLAKYTLFLIRTSYFQLRHDVLKIYSLSLECS